MKKFLKNSLKYFVGIAVLAVLFTAVSTHADFTSNFWSQGAPDVLTTNTPGGLATAAIHVGACYIGTGTGTPCGGGGGGGTVTSILGADSVITGPSPITTTGIIKLKGDSATPAALSYYGTDAGGVLGYNPLPSGSIGGTIGNTQVAFGSGTNTIAGDPAFTWTTNTFKVSASAGGYSPLFTIDDNILGLGIEGEGGVFTTPQGNDVSLIGDFRSVGGVQDQGVFGFINPGGNGNASVQTQYNGTNGNIQISAGDSSGNSFGLQDDSSQGFKVGGSAFNDALDVSTSGVVKISNAYNLPTTDGTNTQVLTTDGSGNVSWQNAGGSTPNLFQVLTAGNSLGGLSIQAASNGVPILESVSGAPMFSADNSGNPLIQFVDSTGGLSGSTLEADANGNPISNGQHTVVADPVFTGTGLDDLTTSGGSIPPGGNTFTLTIDGTNVDGIVMNGGSGTWLVGDTVTSSSGGSATIIGTAINGTLNRFMSLSGTTGTFLNGDTITDGTSSDTATLVGDLFPLDTFTWTTVGGGTFANTPITNGGQLLTFGLNANFGSETGHTLADEWQVQINGYAMTGLNLNYSNDVYQIGDTTGQINGANLSIFDAIFGGRSVLTSRIFDSMDTGGDIGILAINSPTPHVEVGDVNGGGNGTLGDFNDAAETINFRSGGTNFLAMDGGAGTLTVGGAYTLPLTDGSANNVLTTNGSGVASWQPVSTNPGTVTSVGLTVPSGLSISGSPITSSGTFAITTALSGIITGNGSGFSIGTISSPLSFTSNTLSIADAVADGTTKGASTFLANDFNSSSGLISLDYTNGQSADATHKGFLTAADFTNFNNKASNSGVVDWSASDSPTGFSSVATNKFTYQKVGNVVTCSIYIAGVSNSTALGFTLPFAAYSGTGAAGVQVGTGLALDNNGLNNYPGIIQVNSGSTTVAANPLTTLGAASIGVWTAINNKFIIVNFTYTSN